jgi:tetratricopeptide (TPR) repeat protein
VSESSWPLVLEQAEKARGLVADKTSRNEGLRLFDQLASEHSDDGMVYFKRAEAREALDEIQKASSDYKEAQRLFSKKLWQDLARARAEHLDERTTSRKVGERVSRALGRRALEFWSVEQSARGAGTFIKSSPFVSIELARTALVRTVLALEQGSRSKSQARTSWAQRIDGLNIGLPVNKRPSAEAIRGAKQILLTRDRAVYKSERVSEDEARQAFDALIDFISQAV